MNIIVAHDQNCFKSLSCARKVGNTSKGLSLLFHLVITMNFSKANLGNEIPSQMVSAEPQEKLEK